MTPRILLLLLAAAGKERTQSFDKDPGWEGRNNRSSTPAKRTVVQDFGYSRTAHAGGKAGEIGGLVTSAAEPAWYARKIGRKTFDSPLSASGRLLCKGPRFHAVIGFFDSRTVNEWRTPNTVSLRLLGRGDVFYAYVEYATGRWRAGGDTPGGFATVRDKEGGKPRLRGFKTGTALEWSIRYDPKGNKGGGSVTVTLGGETTVCHLGAGHKADGASFDRFGLMPVLKSAHGGGEVWLDDVEVDGAKDGFDRDPGWEGVGNRRRYESADVRPRFDFGYSPTNHAGGKAAGELGGLLFRGDCRFKDRMACYGDRLALLGLDKPLKASGKVAMRRGVTDSTTLLGFYHSEDSMASNPSQESGWPKGFLGAAIEGPSREGFFFYPAYRLRGGQQGHAKGDALPRILPDGKAHGWSLEYVPDGRGTVTVKLGDKSAKLGLGEGHKKAGARFDRFGLVTTWIDGNGQRVYFDDLTYT
ncbi:MAG: hypothetical protein K2W96_05220, partial [Gemmataceae bacterium]|nr:hypothetical protein [Gemmataceae bacterium]